jgi:DNA repair exonuclease SbcCD ATPase subunit
MKEKSLDEKRAERDRAQAQVAAIVKERHQLYDALGGANSNLATAMAQGVGVWGVDRERALMRIQTARKAELNALAAIQLVEARLAAAQRQRDTLVAEVDRLERNWQQPTPQALPAWPDGRLPAGERLTAFEVLNVRLDRRLPKLRDIVNERRVAVDELKRRGASTEPSLERAREARLELQVADRDLRSLIDMRQRVGAEISKLEALA